MQKTKQETTIKDGITQTVLNYRTSSQGGVRFALGHALEGLAREVASERFSNYGGDYSENDITVLLLNQGGLVYCHTRGDCYKEGGSRYHEIQIVSKDPNHTEIVERIDILYDRLGEAEARRAIRQVQHQK